MIVNLTQKERTLLEDQKNHEEICIKKYEQYANLTSCSELKNLLQSHAATEKSHLNSINQLLSGQLPNVNAQGGSSQGQGQSGQGASGQGTSMGGMQGQASQGQAVGGQTSQGQITEKDLCTDLLMTEKYVSNAYDTAIFEFTDPQIRSVLNHIQKEEQQHGEAIYKYMESKGLYQAK
ncbi:MAG: spore coat protein [Clostridiales bacterium]|nr:spore coat protein [Clostridiales bacterium]